MGLDFVILEKGSGVGGTWYWNSYPGAACDADSHLYSIRNVYILTLVVNQTVKF